MTPAIAMIAAVASNGVIGANGTIPWRIPSDMAFFKSTTMGKPIIMGRKQFETVGKPLPGRTNIVVTRRQGYQPEGVLVVDSLEAALLHASSIAVADRADEAMVIGGGEIYTQSIPLADRLYISHVDLEPEGDVFFPPIDPDEWAVSATPKVQASDRDDASYSIRIYTRRRGAPPLIERARFPI